MRGSEMRQAVDERYVANLKSYAQVEARLLDSGILGEGLEKRITAQSLAGSKDSFSELVSQVGGKELALFHAYISAYPTYLAKQLEFRGSPITGYCGLHKRGNTLSLGMSCRVSERYNVRVYPTGLESALTAFDTSGGNIQVQVQEEGKRPTFLFALHYDKDEDILAPHNISKERARIWWERLSPLYSFLLKNLGVPQYILGVAQELRALGSIYEQVLRLGRIEDGFGS